ncbi:MAG: hypothetical protein WCF65_08300 [Parachlamydiaceae bacterium]
MDFVITELGKPVEAIQVAYCNLEDQKTRDREILALMECLEDLGLKTGTILTLAYEDIQTIQGKCVKFIGMVQNGTKMGSTK